MKKIKNNISVQAALCLCLAGTCSCQHFEEPKMKIIPDPPTSSLIYYLPFDNESVADSSLYSFPVAGSAGITFTEGVSGTALQSAPNEYVLIDTLKTDYYGLDLHKICSEMEGFTFSCWMYLKKAEATGGIALFSIPNLSGSEWTSNLDILIDAPGADGSLPVALHVDNYRTGDARSLWVAKDNTPEIYMADMLDRWVHLTIRYSGKSSTVTYFRDGEKVFSKKYPDFGTLKFADTGAVLVGAFQNITTPPVAAGAGKQGWEATFPGCLDQMRFYNRFLTDKEIKELFNSKR